MDSAKKIACSWSLVKTLYIALSSKCNLCNKECDAGKVHEEDSSSCPLVMLGPMSVILIAKDADIKHDNLNLKARHMILDIM